MVINRQDVGDRVGSHIPLTVLGVDDVEFDRVFVRLADVVDLRETEYTGTEYFVVCYDTEFQWIYDEYGIVGGDVLFHRGPLPTGDLPSGQIPPEWQPRQPGPTPTQA